MSRAFRFSYRIKPLESDIKKQILDCLQSNGIYAYNNRNTGLYKGNGEWIPAPMKGVPDIVGFFGVRWGQNKGRALYVEVKHPGNNKKNPAQDLFLQSAREAGCFSLKAYSVEEVERELLKWKT